MMRHWLLSGALAIACVGMGGAGLTTASAAAPAAKKAEKKPETPRKPEDALTPAPHLPERHEGFMKRKEEGKIGLLFLGDSITDRWPRSSPSTWAKWDPYQSADFGVGGDRTEHVLWRIEKGELDGLEGQTKLVVLMIGTNNIGQLKTEKPEWAAAGVKKILDQIHEKIPSAQVLLLGVFPRNEKNSEHRKEIEAINRIISTYGDAKTHYMNINKVFLDENGEIPKEIMADGLHPTDKGYHLWYDAIAPTVAKLMK